MVKHVSDTCYNIILSIKLNTYIYSNHNNKELAIISMYAYLLLIIWYYVLDIKY